MGSLFKARDFWHVLHAEELDTHSLIVDNIDNHPDGQRKIVTGSFQGALRVYLPQQKGYEPHDLLLEKRFDAPIIQIAAAALLPGKPTARVLAILQPKKLILAIVARAGGGGAAPKRSDDDDDDEGNNDPLGSLLVMKHLIEFPLERTAYNMVTGAFGAGSSGAKGQEFVCVQSMDGQLAFFDHNKLMFARFIPSSEFLVPGHLLYVPNKDAFLTNSSTNELHCYKYSTFAQSTGNERKEEGAGRKITPDWVFNLGEDVMDLCTCRVTRGLPGNELEYGVLCERTLYVLKEDGTLRFNRRMDAACASIAAYTLPDGKHQNLIVGTHNKTMLIYDEAKLLWCAAVPFVPIRVAVCRITTVDGMLVAISDCGHVSANYLGTDPASNPVQLLESKDLDYEAVDAEHRRLQNIIKQATTVGRKEPKDLLRVTIDTPQHLPGTTTSSGQLHLQYTGNEPIANIVITISACEPIEPEQKSTVIPSLPAQESLHIPLNFSIDVEGQAAKALPTSLLVEIVILYHLPNGDALTTRNGFLVPLTMVCQAVPVIKNAAVRVQFDTNKEPPHLGDLFGEFAAHPEITSNILSVQYGNGADASIMVSKNGGRYRIQASTFEALWLLASELVRRLKTFFRREPQELIIDHPEPLPVDEYFPVLDRHFDCRQEYVKANEALATVAHQFRAIQKRLLIKFRDRTPAPLSSFEALFDATYRQLYASADAVEIARGALSMASNTLACSTHLLLLIIRYKFLNTMTREDFDAFKNYLSPTVTDATGPSGWEETTEAALTHLLRTTLSKSAKDSAALVQPLATLTDTTRLKKHLTLVFERLAKGAHVVDPATLESPGRRKANNAEDVPVEVHEGRRPGAAGAHRQAAAAPHHGGGGGGESADFEPVLTNTGGADGMEGDRLLISPGQD